MSCFKRPALCDSSRLAKEGVAKASNVNWPAPASCEPWSKLLTYSHGSPLTRIPYNPYIIPLLGVLTRADVVEFPLDEESVWGCW